MAILKGVIVYSEGTYRHGFGDNDIDQSDYWSKVSLVLARLCTGAKKRRTEEIHVIQQTCLRKYQQPIE